MLADSIIVFSQGWHKGSNRELGTCLRCISRRGLSYKLGI
jgi:hypothetical protein